MIIKKFNELFEMNSDEIEQLDDMLSQDNFPYSVHVNMEVDISHFNNSSLEMIRMWCITRDYVPSITIIRNFLQAHYKDYLHNNAYETNSYDFTEYLLQYDKEFIKREKSKTFNL